MNEKMSATKDYFFVLRNFPRSIHYMLNVAITITTTTTVIVAAAEQKSNKITHEYI
jgi:hypothetical protein